MKYALAAVLCVAAVVAGALRAREKQAPPKPRDEWAERYAEKRKQPLSPLPPLERRELPGMSIAMPEGAVLTGDRNAGQLAVGRIEDIVKPVGTVAIVWWRQGTLAELPLAGDPVAKLVEWSRDMGEAAIRPIVEPPTVTLKARPRTAYAHYFVCGDRVVGMIAWHDKAPIGGHIRESFRCP